MCYYYERILGYFLLLTSVCVSDLGVGAQLPSEELRLYYYVVHKQTPLRYVRPVEYANENVHVEISLALIGLDGLNERRQVMTSHIWLRQRWKNPFIYWNPDDYGGVRTVMVPKDVIWTPDIMAGNSISDNYKEQNSSYLVVYNDGMITWIRHDHLETFCDVDMTYFPLDRHNCSIVYRSTNYNSTKLNITYSGNPELDMAHGTAILNMEWVIPESSVTHHRKQYGFDSEIYDDITAYVMVSRRHAYVIQLYVVPLVMFVLMTSSVFMLPAQTAHKFVLGIGLLISEILLLTSLDDVIPSAYRTPPRLGVYYLCAMMLVSVSLAVSAIVANMWNRSKRRSYGVPSCVRVVLLKGLGRLVCLYYEDFLCVDSTPDHIFDQYATSMDTISQGSANHPLDDAKVIREYNSHVVHRAEWRQLAAVVDRIFCLVFWAASIIFIVAMAIKL